MSSENLFTFSVATEAKVQVERESLTQSKKVLDDFYDEYSNKEIDIGFDSKTLKQNISNANKAVADFINKTRKYMKEYNSVVSGPVSWMDADQMKDDFAGVIPTVKDFLSDVRIIFGDGTELFGFDEIFKELEDGATQFEHHLSTGIKSVDFGGQLDKIKQDAVDVFSELEELFSNRHYNDGSLIYDFDEFNQGNLQKAIELLTKLAHLQNAISTFSGKKLTAKDFASKDLSDHLRNVANNMQENLDLMRAYRLQTMEELNKRKEIERSINSWGGPLDMDDAMKQINNEEVYEENLQTLQNYIDKRRKLLDTLDEEPDLFRYNESGDYVGDDIIEGYRETLNDQISDAVSSMDQLREARQKLLDDNDINVKNIDFTQVIRALGEIKTTIEDLGKAFKPFTDAMANSESGLTKMLQTSAEEVDGLIQKFNELSAAVDTIGSKDFNLVQNIQAGGTNTTELVSYRKTVSTLYHQVEGLYNDVQATIVQLSQAGQYKNMGDIIQRMGEFDLAELKKKTKHRTVESLAVDILDLQEAKKLLIEINDIRNKLLGQGSWENIYPDVDIPSNNRDVEQTDTNNNPVLGNPLLNIEQMMDQISSVTEQMREKFNDVKQKINDAFDFSNIQVNYEYIQSATDKIYSYFEELHKKILDLDFTINIPGVIDSKDTPTGNAELVDNYGQKLDDVNSKLLQGTKLLNEQGQIIRLFHNSDTVFDKFNTEQMSESNMLGFGHYLSLDQKEYMSYGKYQTQWYANIQKIFDANAQQKFSVEDATKVVEKYCTDAMETFGRRMLEQLTNGDAFNAVYQIAEAYNKDVSEIFKTAGYDAVKINNEVNVFDRDKIYRANQNVLQCDTEDFKVAAMLTEEISLTRGKIAQLEERMANSSGQEVDNIKEQIRLENERLSTLQEQLATRQKVIDAATAKALGTDTVAAESTTPLFAEAEAMKQIAESARAAAESKKAFADANQQVRVSAQQSAPALLAEKTALGGVDEAAKEQVKWEAPRTKGTLTGLNLPTEFKGEDGQTIAGLFAQVKSQIETMTGEPVTIDFVSKVNDNGQLEAVGATLKYVNEEAGVTIKQFYDISRVTEETEDGEREFIVATQSAEKAMLGAAKAAQVFNTELQQQFAFAQIKTLEAQMGNLELDLTAVKDAASQINDKASLDEFNLQLRIAKEQVKQLKAGLKGQNSLDTVAAAEKRLLTLPDKLEILRQKLKSLGDIEGVEEVTKLINNIEQAYKNFNRETDANKKVDIFKNIISDSVRAESAINRIKNSDAFSDAKEIQSLEERYANLNDVLEKYKNNLSLKSNTGSFTDASLIIDLIESYQRYYNELDKNDSHYDQERLAILQEIDKLYGQLQSKIALVNSEQQVANAEAAKQKKEYDDLAKKQNELYDLKTKLAKAEYGSEYAKNLAAQIKEKESALESEIAKSEHRNALRERAVQLEKDLNAVIADRRNREENAAWDVLQKESQKEKDTQVNDMWAQEEAQRAQDDKDSLKAKKEVAAMDQQIATQQKKEYDDLYARQEALYAKKIKLAKAEYGSENAKNLAEQIDTEETALHNAIAQSEHQNALLERRVQLEKDLNAVVTDRRRKEEDAAWEEVESERNRQDAEKNKEIDDAWAQEDKQKEEELNTLYKERQAIISNIAKLDNDVRNAKNEQGKTAAEELLKKEEQRLAVINQEISAYGNLVDEQKLASQDSGLDERLRKNSYASYIKSETNAQNEAAAQQKKQFEKIRKTYDEYLKTRESIQQMDLDTSGKDYTALLEFVTAKSVKLKEELLKLGIDISSIEENNILTQEQKNALLEDEAQHRERINQITANAQSSYATKQQKEQERINKQNQNYGKSIYNSAQRKYDALAAEVEVTGIIDPKVLAQLDAYKKKLQELKLIRDQFASDPNASSDEGLRQAFNKTAVEAENLRKGIQDVIKEAKKMDAIPEDLIIGKGDVFDTSSVDNIKKSIEELANTLFKGKAQITGWSEDGRQAFLTYNNGAGSIERVTIALKEGTGQLIAYRDATNKSKTAFDSLKDTLGKQVKSLASQFLGIHEAIQALRTGFEAVKEIDASLTELKKVTDETEASYKKFLETASQTAGKIGSTVSDFTEATANFARLGYTMKESAKMAETAIVYKNVADGLDTVEESTESIISTMKAFGIESDNTMSIIDKFNEVGNNFAITSAGIGEALQRSASALYESGNNLDESIALITAANSVIQNPEQVGTALKTLALRLRGTKVELQEAGEDVDGMADSVSQLQAKLKALTHGKVDIMIDADTFKNPTQILREMASAWKDMTDIERSGALELMGGKRQARHCLNVQKCA